MDRRAFLKLSVAASLAGPALSRAAAPSAEHASRRLLVLVELKGGNDGLNTVIPYADPAYRALRPRLAIASEQVVALSDHAGLHPAAKALLPLWQEGHLAIVQGVGYPQPNLSHFRSIEIWDTASASDQYLEQGWLARAFARSPSPAEFAADGVVVGAADMGPLSGGRRAISLVSPDEFLRSARLAREEGDARNPALAHILQVEREVLRSASKLDAGRSFATEFPPGAFGNALRTVAQLAANPAGIAVVRVSLGGFDTHANQLGVHANLLRQLGDGLAALKAALVEIGRWDGTVIATYSEFGRRPHENQSGGTDHGTSSVHFVTGGAVKGGLYGAAPQLDRLDGNGNLPFAIDFRSYYATFLERWWAMPSREILAGRYPPVDFLTG